MLCNLAQAEAVGAKGVLLAPMSDHALTNQEVIALYREVTAASSLPVIAAIKIPGRYKDQDDTAEQLAEIRRLVPPEVAVGISGDAFAAPALLAGCDAWFSVLAGTLPEPALKLARLAQAGEQQATAELQETLQPLWDLFARCGGSLRVIAAAAAKLGFVTADCLPRPLQPLAGPELFALDEVVKTLTALKF